MFLIEERKIFIQKKLLFLFIKREKGKKKGGARFYIYVINFLTNIYTGYFIFAAYERGTFMYLFDHNERWSSEHNIKISNNQVLFMIN